MPARIHEGSCRIHTDVLIRKIDNAMPIARSVSMIQKSRGRSAID
jgi:hypothetical protein